LALEMCGVPLTTITLSNVAFFLHLNNWWAGNFSPTELNFVYSDPVFGTRVARFFLVHDTKIGKMYQMTSKCTKWS
jgi:hypothetical protein